MEDLDWLLFAALEAESDMDAAWFLLVRRSILSLRLW